MPLLHQNLSALHLLFISGMILHFDWCSGLFTLFYFFVILLMGNCQIIQNASLPQLQAAEDETQDVNCADLQERTFPLRFNLPPNPRSHLTASRDLLSANRRPNESEDEVKATILDRKQSTSQSDQKMDDSKGQKNIFSKIAQTSKRGKIKRPPFQMLAFDYTSFIVKKKTSIWEDFMLIKKIGSGSYGSVYLAEERLSGDQKAIKSISKSNLSEEEFQNLVNEFEILRNMDHPNIIKLYDIYEQQNKLFVVTELCEGGNLLNLMKKFTLEESVIRSIMIQLLSAVCYMHNQHILHRDIKLDNVVIVGHVTPANINKIQIKLIDFGISMNLGKQEASFSEFLYGTLLYMPPESLKGTISISWDIWSCGILCYLLATREFPYRYRNDDELNERILKGTLNRKNLHGLPKQMVLFIMSLLNKSYMMRIRATKALKDGWLNKKTNSVQLSKSLKRQTMISLQKYDAKNNLISMIEGYLVTKKINQAERQHLASIFESIDEDHSGIIEVEEFKKFYQDNSEFYNGQEMEELLLTLDKNRSGKIDFNEFISAMCSRRKLFQLESLSEAFDFVDRDGSGQISREEIEELLMGIQSTEVEYLFKTLDSDKNSTISKKEFLAYFQSMINEQ